MGQRLELHDILKALMSSDPAEQHVYFQPPSNVQMKYPCIVYQRDDVDIEYANNNPYRHCKRYQVTVIDLDPDSVIPDKVAALPSARFSTHFVADNLYHDVLTLYF